MLIWICCNVGFKIGYNGKKKKVVKEERKREEERKSKSSIEREFRGIYIYPPTCVDV